MINFVLQSEKPWKLQNSATTLLVILQKLERNWKSVYVYMCSQISILTTSAYKMQTAKLIPFKEYLNANLSDVSAINKFRILFNFQSIEKNQTIFNDQSIYNN